MGLVYLNFIRNFLFYDDWVWFFDFNWVWFWYLNWIWFIDRYLDFVWYFLDDFIWFWNWYFNLGEGYRFNIRANNYREKTKKPTLTSYGIFLMTS